MPRTFYSHKNVYVAVSLPTDYNRGKWFSNWTTCRFAIYVKKKIYFTNAHFKTEKLDQIIN